MRHDRLPLAILMAGALLAAAPVDAQYQMERLSRGVIAVRTSSSQVYVGWRLFGNDPSGIAFNLYRSTNGGAPMLLNGTPLTGSTNFVDTVGTADAVERAISCGRWSTASSRRSASFTLPANAPTRQYLEIPLQIPAGGTTPTARATPTAPTTRASATWTATASTRSCSSGTRPTPRTTRSPATPATSTSTRTSSTAPGCGASTSAATSGPARTTPSSRCTTTTATAGPRSR